MQPLSSSSLTGSSVVNNPPEAHTDVPASNVTQVFFVNPVDHNTPTVQSPILRTTDYPYFITTYAEKYKLELPETLHQSDLQAIEAALLVIKISNNDCLQDGKAYQDRISTIKDPNWQEVLLLLGINLQRRFLVVEQISFLEEIKKIKPESQYLLKAAKLLITACNYQHHEAGEEETLCYSRRDASELLKQTIEKDRNRVHYLQQIVTLVPESDRAAFLRTHIVEAKWNVHLNNPQKTLIIQGSCISEEEQSSMLSYLEDQATMAWEDTAERCRLM